MYGPPALTHFVYVVLVTVFVLVESYMIWYNLHEKAKLKKTGAHPQTKQEEILIESEQSRRDAQKH